MSTVAVERPYVLKYLGTNPPTDISQHVVSIDKFTDVGTGEIASAQIMINTIDGQFLTESNGGATPIIDQFNEFELSVIDDNSVVYSRILYLDDILPQQMLEGQTTEIELYAREAFLKKMKYPGHHYFTSMINMIRIIVSYYNEKRGSAQPEIVFEVTQNGTTTNYLQVPDYPVAVFDFGSGINCYDALMQVISRLRLSVPAQGAGDFFELLFEEHPTDNSKLVCKIFPLGTNPNDPNENNIITLNGKDIDTQYVLETKQPIAANLVVVEGQQDTGRYPAEIAEWTALIEEYRNFPEYNIATAYPADVHVKYKNAVYRSIVATPAGTTPASLLHWDLTSIGEYIGVNFQYSPWTVMKSTLYRNFASNPQNNLNSGYDSPAFIDSNGVVKDGSNYRNVAQFRIRRLEDIPSEYLYSVPEGVDEADVPIIDRIPDDTRVLIDHTLGIIEAPFTGNDQFGNPYRNALVQLRNKKWIVIKVPEHNDAIAVDTEGIVYVYDNPFDTPNPASRKAAVFTPATLAWQSMERQWMGLDCFHYPHSIRNVKGLVEPIQKQGNTFFTDESAVEIEYQFTLSNEEKTILDAVASLFGLASRLISELGSSVVDFLATRAAYNYGWWATLFEAPFPKSTHNGISEKVGELFGGDINNQVPVLDLKNLNYTHDGKRGYDEDSSNDLGQITGIHFLLNFDFKVGNARVGFVGNLPFRCTIYDTEDNVWYSDFTYRFLGDTQQIILPISSFRIYRARNPPALNASDIITNILTPELKILEVFETRKIKKITLQWQESYDNAGRYSPGNIGRFFLALFGALASSFSDQNVRMIGTWDAFGFVKTPIAIAKGIEIGTHHLMENIKQYPNVSNIEQLKKIARAELDLSLFRKDNFTVRTTGKCDMKAGDPLFIRDEDIIALQEKTGVPNTKKLALKKANYTVNAKDGPGGFLRYCTIIARINP